jgi:hypothetical protein
MGGHLVIGRGATSRCKRAFDSHECLYSRPTIPFRKMKALTRPGSESLHALLPPPNTFQQIYPSITTNSLETLHRTLTSLAELCHELVGVKFTRLPPPTSDSYEVAAMVSAWGNTWSRKARRRLEQLRKGTAGGTPGSLALDSVALGNTGESALSLTIRCSFSADGGGSATPLVLEASWMKGKDRELFETFWSHVSRKFAGLVIGDVSR